MKSRTVSSSSTTSTLPPAVRAAAVGFEAESTA